LTQYTTDHEMYVSVISGLVSDGLKVVRPWFIGQNYFLSNWFRQCRKVEPNDL